SHPRHRPATPLPARVHPPPPAPAPALRGGAGPRLVSHTLTPATPRWLPASPRALSQPSAPGHPQSRRQDLARRIGLRGGAACAGRAVLPDRAAERPRRLAQQAGLQLGDEDRQLAAGRLADLAAGTGEPVPGPREREKIGAASVTVSGEHRADAAISV